MEADKKAQIEASLDRAYREFEAKVSAYCEASGLADWEARTAVSSISGIDQLAARVAALMRVLPGVDPLQHAIDISGYGGDVSRIEDVGLAQWTLVASYQGIDVAKESVEAGEFLMAVNALAGVGNALLTAMARLQADKVAEAGAKGGRVAAAVMREVRCYAEKLARENAPVGGWQSAPQAADTIMSELRTFARARGRNPSARKVAEWLRDAGIKRSRSTQ